jgi:cobyrinic acid a,c-diamide synthase
LKSRTKKLLQIEDRENSDPVRHLQIGFSAPGLLSMYPRILIAGTSGDCGKTLVTIGLIAAWRREGRDVAAFKKGPDYIDAAWLSLAAGRPARNLDSWMMGADGVLDSFAANATGSGVNVIEGNRGLHDGEDVRGTHSSAELAKLLGSPVILILAAQKMTRTAAAIALGMKSLDPDLNIAGVLLNRVANSRQESLMRAATEAETGLPVLGSIPRTDENLLPGRHLGLVTPEEHLEAERVITAAANLVNNSVDLNRLRHCAESAPPYPREGFSRPFPAAQSIDAPGLRLGYFAGSAFTFYYPENLEAIDRTGAVRIAVDPLGDSALPPLDALYIGGGFPETHAPSLAENTSFRRSVAEAAQKGLPVWAECGGLMYLAQSIHWQDSCFPMAGFLPVDIVLGKKPAGHGYEEVLADRPNAFVNPGTILRGHEFHYSRIEGCGQFETAFKVLRGTGIGGGRDGITKNRVIASYLHVHDLASPGWINWLMNAAVEYKREGV